MPSVFCTKISIYLANFHAFSLPALLSRSEVLLSPLRASGPGISAQLLHIATYFLFNPLSSNGWYPLIYSGDCWGQRWFWPQHNRDGISSPCQHEDLSFFSSSTSGWQWPNSVLLLRIFLSVPQLPWSLGKQSASNLGAGPPSSPFSLPITDMMVPFARVSCVGAQTDMHRESSSRKLS